MQKLIQIHRKENKFVVGNSRDITNVVYLIYRYVIGGHVSSPHGNLFIYSDSTSRLSISTEGEVGLATWWLTAILNRCEGSSGWLLLLLLLLLLLHHSFFLKFFFLFFLNWSLILGLALATESIVVIAVASSKREVGVSSWHLSTIFDRGQSLHVHALCVVVTASLHF